MNIRLYVEPMDATVVEISDDGRVRLEGDEWFEPSLQERRAIIYAAQLHISSLTEALEVLDRTGHRSGHA